MNITIASKLMELYAACPKCGCEVIGNGKGLLECDTAAGFFKRSYRGIYARGSSGAAGRG